MATIHYAAFLAILTLFQSHITIATFNPEDVCRETNVCGRGKCERDRDSVFGFECKCDDGWIQARNKDDRYFKFLPCIIPDWDICKENVCGRGKCERNDDSIFGFECKCEDGWIQARNNDDRFFKFLPCIIPECLLNRDCFDAFPPLGDNERRPDLTNYDPCSLIECGGGRCRKTSPFTRVCECKDDYFNLFGSPAFPCYKQCAFGEGCPSVGLDFANNTTSVLGRNPSFSDKSTNQAQSLIQGTEIACLITIIITVMAMVY